MANLGGNLSPKTHRVCVDTDIETRLLVPLNHVESVSDFKDKVCDVHNMSFPELEEINITALNAENRGKLYRLPDHMNVSQAFNGTSGDWNLYANTVKVGKEDLLVIEVDDEMFSNTELVQGNDEEIGIDSALVDVHNKDPSVEEGLDENQVAEKTTGKRKGEMSDGEKSGKKRAIDLNQSADAHADSNEVEAVAAAPKSESCAVLPREENETGEKYVKDMGKATAETDKLIDVNQSAVSMIAPLRSESFAVSLKEKLDDVPIGKEDETGEKSLEDVGTENVESCPISTSGNLENPFVAATHKEKKKRNRTRTRKRGMRTRTRKRGMRNRNSKEPICSDVTNADRVDILVDATQNENGIGEKFSEIGSSLHALVQEPTEAKTLAKKGSLVASKNVEPMEAVDGEGADKIEIPALDKEVSSRSLH